MARTVYGLDLEDLPLVRLNEQKRRKKRQQLESKPPFTKDFARISKMEIHSTINQKRERNNLTGSPKLLREVPTQSAGMSSAPVTPNAQRPEIEPGAATVYPLEGQKKDLQPSPLSGSSAFKKTEKMLSLDETVRRINHGSGASATTGRFITTNSNYCSSFGILVSFVVHLTYHSSTKFARIQDLKSPLWNLTAL